MSPSLMGFTSATGSQYIVLVETIVFLCIYEAVHASLQITCK